MSNTHFLILKTIFLNSFVQYAHCLSCTTQYDCYKYYFSKHQPPCSFCVDDPLDISNSRCISPFSHYFPNNVSHYCEFDKNCSSISCSDAGICYTTLTWKNDKKTELKGSYPSCQCVPPYFGYNCETIRPNARQYFSVTYVELEKSSYAPGYFEEVKLFLGAINKETFNKIQIVLKTEEDYYYPVAIPCNHPFCSKNTNLRGVNMYKIAIRFPFKKYELTDHSFLRHGNEVIGYLTNFTLNINVDGEWDYRREFTELVHYYRESLQCISVIELNDCGISLEKATSVTRPELIEITRSVKYFEDGKFVDSSKPKPSCASMTSSNWKIWKIGSEITEFSLPILESFGKNKLFFEPFQLDIGEYKVVHEVKYLSIKGTSLSYKNCYFNISRLPVIARIHGGSEFRIFKANGLSLISKSYDPNMPHNRQGHLQVEWSCVRLNPPQTAGGEQDRICQPRTMESTTVYRISPSKLTYGVIYNFTLKVFHIKKSRILFLDSTFVVVRVANKTEKIPIISTIFIQCVQNCGRKVIPNSVLILQVRSSVNLIGLHFEWTYQQNDTPSEFLVTDVPCAPHMIIVKRDFFKHGASYTVVASDVATGWVAKYSFRTDELNYDGNCTTTPEFGIKGSTLFLIQCTPSRSLKYEFYDMSDSELNFTGSFRFDILNGRMIGTTNTGYIRNVRLTRGNVFVCIYNNNGLNVTKIMKVNLESQGDSCDENNIINDLQQNIKYWDLSKTLRYITVLTDMLGTENNTRKTIVSLLSFFNSIEPSGTIEGAKLWASTLLNVLLKFKKEPKSDLSPGLLADLMSGLNNLAKDVNHNIIKKQESNRWVSPDHLRDISKGLLECLFTLATSIGDKYKMISEETIELSTLKHLQRESEELTEVLDCIEDLVGLVQASGSYPNYISTSNQDIVVWVMRDEEIHDTSRMLELIPENPITISHELLFNLKRSLRTGEELVLKAATITNDLFSWHKSSMHSTLTSVGLKKQKPSEYLNKIEYIEKPIEIRVKTKNETLNTVKYSGSIHLNPNEKLEILDLSVRVHRIRLMPLSLTIIHFQPVSKEVLRVLALKDQRPDYEMLASKSSDQTKFDDFKASVLHNETNSTVYKVVCSDHDPKVTSYRVDVNSNEPELGIFKVVVGENPVHLYIGMIPDLFVPANTIVSYSFEVTTVVCKVWVRGKWSRKGCKVYSYTTRGNVSCLCNHFSIFSSIFPVPPEKVDPYNDFPLFLTIVNNPIVAAVVISLLILFILCNIIVKRKDKTNKNLKSVIVLGDNYPKDTHPFLLAVYTGSRFNSGTSAHVGIMIIGQIERSRPHILSCKTRKVLQTNSDDWFVLLSPRPLGKLKCLQIWHDNHGPNPDWYCETIYVYDLIHNTETRFVIEQWLSLKKNDYPEATALPAKMDDINSVKRNFISNFVTGMCEEHIVASVFWRHPRSEISRLQRNCILMCYIIVVMMCSIMFYKYHTGNRIEDDFNYTVAYRDVLISIETLIISVIIISAVKVLFRASYKFTHGATVRSTLEVRRSTENIDYENMMQQHGRSTVRITRNSTEENSFQDKYSRIVTKAFNTRRLTPVKISPGQKVVKIRRALFITAWIVSGCMIAICMFLVTLYGLKMGEVNSLEWFTSVVLTLGQEIFITGPIRIIFVALILSIAFKKLFDMNTHIIRANQVLNINIPSDPEHYEKLMRKRSRPRYAPLTSKQRATMIHKQMVQSQWMALVDFAVAVCFAIVLGGFVVGMYTFSYYTNYHICSLVASGLSLGTIDFRKVTNISTAEIFLDSTFVQSMYALRWYNNDFSGNEKDKIYWASDMTNRMLGLPTLRQVRFLPAPCVNLIGTQGLCRPHWRHLVLDTDDYDEGWTAALYSVRRRMSPWKFSDQKKLPLVTLYRLHGESGQTYDDSGYLTTLGPSLRQTEMTLADLNRYRWLSWRTQAVFVETTLYNGNVNQFSQVTLQIEFLMSGVTLTKVQARTIDADSMYYLLNVVFLVFILYYLSSCAYYINREGLMTYLSELNNALRFVLAILGCTTIIVVLIHFYRTRRIIEEFQRNSLDTSFDFDKLFFFFQLLFLLIAVLTCIAFTRMILLLRAGKTFLLQFYTLKTSYLCVFWLALVFCLTFLNLYMQSFLIGIVFDEGFMNIVLKNKITQNYSKRVYKTERAFLTEKYICTKIIKSMFVIIFIFYIQAAQTYRSKLTNDTSFITFFAERIKNICRSINPNNVKSEVKIKKFELV